jgi:hypothetical protein
MTNQHPIIPSPELVHQWHKVACKDPCNGGIYDGIATQAARWGADQELEACVKWIEDCGYHPSVPEDFRAARRPKPPSLKEQALAVLDDCSDRLDSAHENTIRRALEALDD